MTWFDLIFKLMSGIFIGLCIGFIYCVTLGVVLEIEIVLIWLVASFVIKMVEL